MRTDWQRHVLASSGYLQLGMLDDAALALEEIEPGDKIRTEVPGARIALYITAKKWDMAAAVASHLVKVEPQNKAWWINLAYSIRRSEGPSDRDNGDPRCSLRMRRRAVTGPRRAPLRFLRIPTGEAMLPRHSGNK